MNVRADSGVMPVSWATRRGAASLSRGLGVLCGVEVIVSTWDLLHFFSILLSLHPIKALSTDIVEHSPARHSLMAVFLLDNATFSVEVEPLLTGHADVVLGFLGSPMLLHPCQGLTASNNAGTLIVK